MFHRSKKRQINANLIFRGKFEKAAGGCAIGLTRGTRASGKQFLTLEEQTDYYMKSTSEKDDNKKIHYNDIVDVDMETFDDDPFFIKKDEMARKSIEKYGLPEELMKKYRDEKS